MCVFDFYCAICGGPFKSPHQLLYPLSDEAEIDRSSFGKTNVKWLQELRLIGRNLSTGRAYVTGLGTAQDHGWAKVERGQDANVPTRTQGLSVHEAGKVGLPAYNNWSAMGDGDDGAGYPVHDACWELLRTAHSIRDVAGRKYRRGSANLDIDVALVKRAMDKARKGGAGHLCGIEYLEFQPVFGEDSIWGDADAVRIRQPWLSDPSTIVKVDLPQATSCGTHRNSVTKSADPFSALPTEVFLQTMNSVSGHEFLRFFAAFPASKQRCDGQFWRSRILRDMPYLYELAEEMRQITWDVADMICWECLYRQMLEVSYPPLAPQSRDAGGLACIASRRRVWRCAEQLLDLCEQQQIAVGGIEVDSGCSR